MIIMCAWALRGLLLGVIEVAPDGLLELREHRALELARRDVDLDVELRQLGLEVVVGDQLQHVLVRQRRIAGLLGQVELDLEPDRAPVGIEPRLREHPREHVKAQLDLVPVALTVLAGEGGFGDFIAHGASSCRVQSVRKRDIPDGMSLSRPRSGAAASDLRVVRADRARRGEHGDFERARRAAHRRARRRRPDPDGAPVRRAHDRRPGASGGREWWGNCAWDAFGIVAALGPRRTPRHRPGHHARARRRRDPRRRRLRSARPRRPLVGRHRPSPERRCGSSGRRRTSPRARRSTSPTLMRLARRWYGDRLDPDWRPRTRDESQAILDRGRPDRRLLGTP